MTGAILGGAAVSGGLGLIGSGINYAIQKRLATQDRAENYKYGEMAAENADARTRALYSDFFSPEALMRQYKDAGLSPSLMFGGTPGQGGQSGAQGTGAAGIQTHFAPQSLIEAAQAASLFANAKKANAEANTLEGENERGEAEIANILAETGKTKAEAAYTNMMSTWQGIQNYVAENTKDLSIKEVEEQVDLLQWQATNMKWIAKNSKLQFDINSKTAENQVKLLHEQVSNIIADTALKSAQKELTDEQKGEVREHIRNMSGMLQVAKEHLNNETFILDYQKQSIESGIKYQKDMIEYLNKSLGINDKNADWDRITGVITKVVTAAAQIGMMYYLKGGKGINSITPLPYKGIDMNGNTIQ